METYRTIHLVKKFPRTRTAAITLLLGYSLAYNLGYDLLFDDPTFISCQLAAQLSRPNGGVRVRSRGCQPI